MHRFNRCCISSSHTHPWSRVEGGVFGCVKISRCMVTSLMSCGMINCFMTYHTMSSAVQYPCLTQASAMDFGIASSSSVRSTLSTAFCASGIFFLSPNIYIYMQALDWLFEKDCFEAIDHVGLVHDLESLITNISVHHLSRLQLQTCIYHTMFLTAVSSPICCMPCSWTVT